MMKLFLHLFVSLFFMTSVIPIGFAGQLHVDDNELEVFDDQYADDGGLKINTGDEGDDWGFGGSDDESGGGERAPREEPPSEERPRKEKRRERERQEEQDEEEEKRKRKERRRERKAKEEKRESEKKPRRESRRERRTQEEAAEDHEDRRRTEGPRERSEARKREMEREPPERRREARRERRRGERGAERDERRRRREGPNERRRTERQTEHNEWKRRREAPREARRTENRAEHNEHRRRREAPRERRRTERRSEHNEHRRRREAPRERRNQQEQQRDQERRRRREAPKEARRTERRGEHERWRRNREAPREARRGEATREGNDRRNQREQPREARRTEKATERNNRKRRREEPKEARRQEGGREHQEWKDRREARSEKPKQREQAKEVSRKEKQDAKDSARDDKNVQREQKEAQKKRDAEARRDKRREDSKLTAEERRQRAGNRDRDGRRGGSGGEVSWTDENGKHTIKTDADGNRTETHENKDGSKTTIQKNADGTTVTTETDPEGETTTTSTGTDANGNEVETVEFPDGKTRTTTTTGDGTTITTERDPSEHSGPHNQTGTETTTVTDAEGNVIATKTVDKYGNTTVVRQNEDGSTTTLTQERGDTEITEVTVNDGGYGKEVTYDAEGNVLSEREVVVTESTDQDGRKVTTVVGSDGKYSSTALNEDGSPSYYSNGELGDDDDNTGVDQARFLYERSRQELKLDRKWDELSPSEQREYQRWQQEIDERAERRARDEAFRRRLEEQQKALDERFERERKELNEKIEADRKRIQERHEANERRIEKERQDRIRQEQEQQRQQQKQQEEQQRRQRNENIIRDRFEREVDNPSSKNEVREFKTKLMVERLHRIRRANEIAIDQGYVDVVDENDVSHRVQLTEQQIKDAKTRIHLVNNLDNMLSIEDGNRIARLEVTERYAGLVGRETYAGGSARDVFLNQGEARSVYNMSDFRAKQESSGDAYVDALESAAVTGASVSTRQQVDEGILVGTEALARGLNDWFTAMNPGDPFLQAAIGVKTSGADVGRNLSAGERVFELGKGVVELGADVGMTRGVQSATRQPGSARVIPQGVNANQTQTGLPTSFRGTRRNATGLTPGQQTGRLDLTGDVIPSRAARPRGMRGDAGPGAGTPTPDLDIKVTPRTTGGGTTGGTGPNITVTPKNPGTGNTRGMHPAATGQAPDGLPRLRPVSEAGQNFDPLNVNNLTTRGQGLRPPDASGQNLPPATSGNTHVMSRNQLPGGRDFQDPTQTGGPGNTHILSRDQLPGGRNFDEGFGTSPGDTQILNRNQLPANPGNTHILGRDQLPPGQIPVSQQNIPLSYKQTPYPQNLGDPNLTHVNHAGMNVDLRPGAKPPAGIDAASRQEWNDVRAQHQVKMARDAGQRGSQGGDGFVDPSGPNPIQLPPIGSRAEGLSPQQLDNLFDGGVSRKLDPDDVVTKADAILDFKNPQPLRNPDFRDGLNQAFGRGQGPTGVPPKVNNATDQPDPFASSGPFKPQDPLDGGTMMEPGRARSGTPPPDGDPFADSARNFNPGDTQELPAFRPPTNYGEDKGLFNRVPSDGARTVGSKGSVLSPERNLSTEAGKKTGKGVNAVAALKEDSTFQNDSEPTHEQASRNWLERFTDQFKDEDLPEE